MKKTALVLLAAIVLLSFATSCYQQPSSLDTESEQEAPAPVEPPAPETVEITITAVGDVMTHDPQLEAAYYSEAGYSFSNNYRFVAPYIREADLAIANLETTLAGPNRRYQGYPTFNTPDALADALSYAGFDVIVTANNHSYDSGKEGFLRTQQVLDSLGFGYTGSRMDEDAPRFYLEDVNGVIVAVTAFTYESTPRGGRKTINGIVMEPEMEDLINSFHYSTLEQDLLDMAQVEEEMRLSGADVAVFYLHWGKEYNLRQSQTQEFMAEYLARAGVDVIFGSHPHVLQPVDIIYADDGSETVVFYSLGNFISNQRRERKGFPYAEDGMVAGVTYVKDLEAGRVSLTDVDYLPTWVNLYQLEGRDYYEIVPLPPALDNPLLFGLQGQALEYARDSEESTNKILRSLLDETSPAFRLFNEEEI